nr:lamin tail domain-containing protein [Marinobacter sp. DS40M8]
MTIKQSVLAAAIASTLTAPAFAELVISEYVEGSSNNKAIELLNTGTSAVDLTAWELQVFYNGSNATGLTINLDGTVAPDGTFVFAHSQSDPAILAVADQTTGAGLFNGDDAVLLLNGGVVADSIGQVGVDPGSYWGDTVRTQNQTLRRRDGTNADNNPDDAYDPAVVFDSFAVDSFDDLGNGAGDGGEEPTDPGLPDMACGNPASLISDIQAPVMSARLPVKIWLWKPS